MRFAHADLHGPTYLEAAPVSMWLGRDLPGVLLYRTDRGLFLHDETSDSYAVLDLTTGHDGQWEARQTGSRRIWDELRASLDNWFDADQPGLDAWRVFVEDDGEVELLFVGEDCPTPLRNRSGRSERRLTRWTPTPPSPARPTGTGGGPARPRPLYARAPVEVAIQAPQDPQEVHPP